jgi:hypothetical protein
MGSADDLFARAALLLYMITQCRLALDGLAVLRHVGRRAAGQSTPHT